MTRTDKPLNVKNKANQKSMAKSDGAAYYTDCGVRPTPTHPMGVQDMTLKNLMLQFQ